MTILASKQQIFNHEVKGGEPSTAILSQLDLIEYEALHHQEQAAKLVQLARWHEQQARVLATERRALAADVDAVLAQVEGLLR